MNVLMLAPHAFHLDRGTPIAVDLVLRAFSERGASVDVVTYHLGADRDYPGIRLHRIPAPPGIRYVPPGMSARKLVCDALLLREAWRLVRRSDYDVIHAGEEAVFIGMLFKSLYGIPYTYDMDSSIAQQTVEKLWPLRPAARLLDWVEGRAIRGSTATAPVCNALADLAIRRGAPYVETLHDISQLADDDFVPGAGLRERFGISGKIIMYVGNLEPYQGIDLLLESAALAARDRDDFTVVVAGGEGDAVAGYQRRAQQLGLDGRVHFIGPWPAARIGALLAEADILAAPRIRGINTPMKVFPYLHSGKPVLATDLPTHNQILDGSVAYLAPADPAGFSKGMVRLVEDDELRQRLGNAGRAFVRQGHTWEAYRMRFDRLYDHVERSLSGARTATDAHHGA
jgi:glycosyltransferase involved in cell wall biosynthesis